MQTAIMETDSDCSESFGKSQIEKKMRLVSILAVFPRKRRLVNI
jgi:hypothetical protein